MQVPQRISLSVLQMYTNVSLGCRVQANGTAEFSGGGGDGLGKLESPIFDRCETLPDIGY